jgi:copper homeostasis protein
MKKYPLLEICVETLEAALAAERGGADRIELCEDLSVGGLTPGVELMRTVRGQIRIPVFAMIRPRSGNFCYSAPEFQQMNRDIAAAKKYGMDGVVLGVLRENRQVDVECTRALIKLAQPLPVTFHRAFDETPNLLDALENVISTGAARILTSGGKPKAEQGSEVIAELVRVAESRIAILAGGGINGTNLEQLALRSGAREFHSGLSSTLPYPRTDYLVFEAEVRNMAEVLRKNPGSAHTRGHGTD